MYRSDEPASRDVAVTLQFLKPASRDDSAIHREIEPVPGDDWARPQDQASMLREDRDR